MIDLGKGSDSAEAKKLVGELEEMLEGVMNSYNHNWSIGKEDPAAKADRERRSKEFQDR